VEYGLIGGRAVIPAIITAVTQALRAYSNWATPAEETREHRINVFHEHSNRNIGSYVSDIPRIRMREETKEPLEDEVDPVEEIEKEIKERIHKKRRMLYGNNVSSNSTYGINTGKNGQTH